MVLQKAVKKGMTKYKLSCEVSSYKQLHVIR